MGKKRQAIVVGDVVHIPLTKGFTAIVDLVDADLAEFDWWTLHPSPGRWYAARKAPRPKADTVLLHRVIAERVGLDIEGKDVDHRDTDTMNCRRQNLRAATKSQNGSNRGANKNNRSGAKGVYQRKSGRWGARIGKNRTYYRFGLFDTMEEAAAAYAAAAERLHGDFARVVA